MSDALLTWARAQERSLVGFIREMVECESPSGDAAAIGRFVELFAERLGGLAKCKTVAGGKWGPHLICDFDLPGPRRKDGRVLVLGHSDTVYPMGILKTMPWREAGGRLHGPGVLDMKGGLAIFVFAMRALRELDLPVRRRVILQMNSEEEVGSPSSRALTEKNAPGCEAVLVLEPGTGLTGKLKTARKGIGRYGMTVKGVAAHAGVDFAAGASAIVEAAHQIGVLASFTNLERGVTVNPGVIAGGTRSNVIAETVTVEIDVRSWTLRDYHAVHKKLMALKARDKRCVVEVEGELNRPPMERTRAVARLFKIAQQCGAAEESRTGGGSDGNFTAALGVPTLDGLGVVGEGAHAPHESILVDRLADRTALLARLVAAI